MPVTQIDGGRQIRANTITNNEISTSAAIALSKLATPVIAANGSQAHTADQSMGGFKLTNVATPTSDTDAATKGYVDGVAAGLDTKASVKVATTAAGTLSTSFANGQTVDGVTLVTGDRILVKNQATGSENGIYTVNASGSPTRATDADTNAEVTSGMFVFVEQGTANADSGWVLTTDGAVVLGTTSLTFTQFSGAGQVTAGAGLTKTGNTIDVGGTANRIVVSADSIDIGTDVTTNAGTQSLTNKTMTDTTNNVAAKGLHSATTVVSVSAATAPSSGQVLTATSSTTATWQSPAGAPTFVTRETPTGLVNGSNTSYTLANTPIAGSEMLFLNGVLQDPGAGQDYTISGNTITYLTAPATGDKLRISYRY